jgi:hypothetical protein
LAIAFRRGIDFNAVYRVDYDRPDIAEGGFITNRRRAA